MPSEKNKKDQKLRESAGANIADIRESIKPNIEKFTLKWGLLSEQRSDKY